jgi:hypothetical protein
LLLQSQSKATANKEIDIRDKLQIISTSSVSGRAKWFTVQMFLDGWQKEILQVSIKIG